MALAFLEVGTEKVNLTQDAFEKIEQFVVFMYEKNSEVTTVNAARQSCSPNDAKPSTRISPQSTKVAISIRLGMDQGQPWKPLWTTLRHAEDSYYEPICTVAANKTVKQDASVQLPTSHVLPYATLEAIAMQNSLMTAFESSSRFCVSCCNFVSVQVRNLLSPVRTLD